MVAFAALVVFQEDSRKEERHTVQVDRQSWLGKEIDQQAVGEVVLGDKQGPVHELYTNQVSSHECNSTLIRETALL